MDFLLARVLFTICFLQARADCSPTEILQAPTYQLGHVCFLWDWFLTSSNNFFTSLIYYQSNRSFYQLDLLSSLSVCLSAHDVLLAHAALFTSCIFIHSSSLSQQLDLLPDRACACSFPAGFFTSSSNFFTSCVLMDAWSTKTYTCFAKTCFWRVVC